MTVRAGLLTVRLLPVVFVAAAASVYVAYVESGGDYVLRNVLPILVLVALAALALYRGGGSWTGSGWCWPLGTAGFAIPSLGLSMYLHYAYMVNLEGVFSESLYPQEVFRFLPAYTLVAGGTGFAIGWIAGRNV